MQAGIVGFIAQKIKSATVSTHFEEVLQSVCRYVGIDTDVCDGSRLVICSYLLDHSENSNICHSVFGAQMPQLHESQPSDRPILVFSLPPN